MEYKEDPCRDLRDLLAGNLRAEYFSDVEAIRQHWRECEKCRASFPDGIAQLKGIEDYALSQIRRNIGRLHEQYSSEKRSILFPPEQIELEPLTVAKPQRAREVVLHSASDEPSESQEPHMRVLILLANKGETLREQLQVINDNWGLDVFRVALFDDGEYSSRVCGSLIASLTKDVQSFVFQAILAADVLNLFEGEFPPEFGRTMLRTVERAVPEFLRLYLDGQKKLSLLGQSILSAPHEQRLSVVSEKIERLAVDLEDVGDSLKAGQMEIFRQLKGRTYQPTEIDEDIMNLLGKELFGKLSSETRRLLNKAECAFRSYREADEFRPSILDFHRAYEYEFRHRVSGPLANKLVENGYTNYPPADGQKQLVVARKFNGKLGLGDQLWFLLNDELVRSIVSALGFDVEEVHRGASRVNAARNDAAHGRIHSATEATHVRDTLLGTHSCLKSLFPSSRT